MSYHRRVVMVLNTASLCRFTHQNKALQTLSKRYRKQEFITFGVPSNDFGNQELKNEDQIKQFCEINYDIDFPMTSTVQVTGKNAHTFYKWVTQEKSALAKPHWNFHKYLIGPDGRTAERFATPRGPTSQGYPCNRGSAGAHPQKIDNKTAQQ